jgi:predicted metal-binding membrane protein
MPSIALPRPRLRQGALASIGLLLGLALIAWLLSAGRMAGMDAGPGTDPGALGFYLVTWMMMMAAMMLPSIAPMVLAHGAVERRATRGKGQSAATAAFVAGYLTVPTSASSEMTMEEAS